MGDLRDGDTVFGADGQPCKVLKAHDVLLGEPCYEVEFDDGTVIVASRGPPVADRGPGGESPANGARRDAAPSRARDRLPTGQPDRRGDPDELVTAAELAAEIDDMAGTSSRSPGSAGSCRWARPVMMTRHYQAIGRMVFKPPSPRIRRSDLPRARTRLPAGPRAAWQAHRPAVVTTQEIRDSLQVGGYVNLLDRRMRLPRQPEQELPVRLRAGLLARRRHSGARAVLHC